MKSLFSAVLLSFMMFIASPAFAGDKIDINHASAEQLTAVKGIGPKLSEKIVSYREAHGSFGDVSELVKVRGIGEKSLSHIRGDLVATPEEGSDSR